MKRKFLSLKRKAYALTMAVAMVISGLSFGAVPVMAADPEHTVLNGTAVETPITAPAYNSANVPKMDTSGTVAYWYAGNKFLALNQFNHGAKQAGEDITIASTTVSDGTMKWYRDDAYGYRGQETTNASSERGDKLAILTDLRGARGAANDNGGSSTTVQPGDGTSDYRNIDKQTYVQAQDEDFFSNGSVWELMDSDAVWDDDYLFAQYKSGSFAAVTAAFAPTILNTVESWYNSGFSYSGGGTAVSAQGDYFSAAEKALVKSATIKTDGVTGSQNTSSNDTLNDAHLFAPSVDEIYYNPRQVQSIFSAWSADYGPGTKGANRSDSDWQYPRSHLWLRSFWGVGSGTHRSGVSVNSTGARDRHNVASEFAVAPAFYLDTKGVVMAKDATNAAASAAARHSILQAYDANAVNENKSVKFLVPAAGFADSFETSATQKSVTVSPGGTYSITYTGADTEFIDGVDSGNNHNAALVISAIIYDQDGKVLYYGNLDAVSNSEGNVDITMPNLPNGSYTLAVFEEQLGGTSTYTTSGDVDYTSYETDYQGAVSYTTLNVQTSQNETGFDANVWYVYHDDASNIDWNFKLNEDGDVIGLYTTSANISGIIDSGNCLNVPAKINDRTVIAIGGENESQPFIPASQQGWTSISFPQSLATINDYAFIGSKAPAKIVIPATISAIGVKAFFGSGIKQVVLSEFNGVVGSYAFANTEKLTTATICGGDSGATLSTVCFSDSALNDVSITGNVRLNKMAFRNNIKLKNINLNGSVSIGEYAFDGCTSLETLYLPHGTSLDAYAFSGCTSITSLEADCDLPSHSFEGTGNITTIILDGNCSHIAYDWEGNSTNFAGDATKHVIDSDELAHTYDQEEYTNPGRTIYARSANVLYGFYGKEDTNTYLSPFGASGTVQVYIQNDENPSGSESTTGETLSLLGKTVSSNATYTKHKNANGATAVIVSRVGNIATFINKKNITVLAEVTREQTGINAYYSGTVLTTKDIDKSKMTVKRVYGAEEGASYNTSEFYVIRTSDFNTELSSQAGVLEANVAAYEPITAKDSDLKSGQNTGTVSATVVVFYDDNGTPKYFSVPVSIRVESYNAKSYIEQAYGSYDAVAQAFVDYENRIKSLEKALEDADVDSVEALSKELAECKKMYADLVAELESYVKNNKADNSGYFGTTTDPSSGSTTNVVFIEGNATPYEETEKTDSEGNKVYSAEYDTNGDSTPDPIYFVVKDDGVHLVDENGEPVKKDGSQPAQGEDGDVYSDKLGALQRQLTAQIADLKRQLDACEAGINKIKKAINDAGVNYNNLSGADDYEKIVSAIKTLAEEVEALKTEKASLTTDLEDARDKISAYANALNNIYNKLTGEDLTAEQAAAISTALAAVNTKIEKLQSDLSVAQATVLDLRSKLADAEADVVSLTAELEKTTSDLEQAEADLTQASVDRANLVAEYEAAIAAGDAEKAEALQKEIADKEAAIAELTSMRATLNQKLADLDEAKQTVLDLQALIEQKDLEITRLRTDLDALSSTADGYKITVDVANRLFGTDLGNDATVNDISDAINAFVKDKLNAETAVKGIQTLLNVNTTGDALVSDVANAISNGGNGGTSGNERGGESGGSGIVSADYTGYTKDVEVNEDSQSYKTGYTQGYTDGSKANAGTSTGNADYKTAYNEGYSAGEKVGKASVNTSEYYDKGYDKGYKAGEKAGNASASGSYSEGYSDGYSDGKSDGRISSSGNSTESYNNGYNAGFTAGQKSVSTSATVTTTQAKPATATTTTTTNNSTSTTTKKEDISIEGSTTGANKPSTSSVSMGQTYTRAVPTSTETAKTQKAKVEVNELNGTGIALQTNGKSIVTAGSDKKENAMKLVKYYAGNLSELGSQLGSNDLKKAATDQNTTVTFDVVASVDVTPTDAQKELIKNKKDVSLEMTSPDFDKNAIYLMVHESDARTGEYDVALLTPKLATSLNNNSSSSSSTSSSAPSSSATLTTSASEYKLTATLKDLSPVTITKVTITKTNVQIEEPSSADSGKENTEAAKKPENTAPKEDKGGNPVAVVIVLVITVAALVVLFILIKKKGGLNFRSRK